MPIMTREDAAAKGVLSNDFDPLPIDDSALRVLPDAPTSVKIGNLTYAVFYGDDRDLEARAGQSLWGHVVHGKRKIGIHEDLKGKIDHCVLVHEAVHAMIAQSGQDDDGLEPLVVSLGYSITAFIRDNPDVIKWIQNHE